MEQKEQVEQSRQEKNTAHGAIKRRGLIAGAAAFVAALAVKNVSDAQPVAAAPYTLQGDTYNPLGSANTILQTTGQYGFESITYFNGTGQQPAFALGGYAGGKGRGVGVQGVALIGLGSQGQIADPGYPTDGSIGTQGLIFAPGTNHTGVQGYIYNVGDSTFAIEGRNDGQGNTRTGVLGTIGPLAANRNDNLTVAVNGLNLSTGPQAYGVYGHVPSSSDSIGVTGHSGLGIGVFGRSDNGNYAIVGTAVKAGAIGLAAYSYGQSGVAVYAVGPTGSGYAGYFNGTVQVNGNFQVFNGAKNVAVSHPDGSYRLLHCVEAPEAWFEDFGEAKLVGGKAEITLDPDFAAVVDTSTMHAFCMETDANHALYLTNKSATGFTVAADAEALAARGKKITDANSTFSYRVVAKRKDLKTTRFERVKLAPKAPAPPEPPTMHYDATRFDNHKQQATIPTAPKP